MFNKMAKNNTSDSPSVNIIGAGTVIEGDITTNGDMRIDGSLTGTINVKGKLVVGASGAGKTSIINAYNGKTFDKKIKATGAM